MNEHMEPEIFKIYKKALDNLDGDILPLHFGPAHIVWEDGNITQDMAQWCLDNFDKYKGNYNNEELHIVKQSLIELLEYYSKL